MKAQGLRIGLAIICIGWILSPYFISMPIYSKISANNVFVHDKESKFLWMLPDEWVQVQSLTSAQYAFNHKKIKNVSLVLHVWKEDRETNESMVTNFRNNPRLIFDSGIIPRFPNSKFLSSSVESINLNESIHTDFELITPFRDDFIKWYACQEMTIKDGISYNFVIECPPDTGYQPDILLRQALKYFIFSNDKKFTYVSGISEKYQIEYAENGGFSTLEDFKMLVDEVIAYEQSAPQDFVPAIINSFLQGMVSPFSELPSALFRYLDSPLRIKLFDDLLEKVKDNFYTQPIMERNFSVRLARFAPTAIYAALLLMFFYRKKK